MIKKKIIFTIFGLLLVLYANCQVYDITTFDNINNKVHVELDYVHNILSVYNHSDTIHISDFTELSDSPKLIDKHFLRIKYGIRAGSDVSYTHVLILCVYKNRLIESLHITSSYNYVFNKTYNREVDSLKLFDEKGNYSTELSLVDFGNTYKLEAAVYNYHKSKQDISDNFSRNESYYLSFDTDRYIFYSGIYDLHDNFLIYQPPHENAFQRPLDGRFPMIKLDSFIYYYIDNAWYEKDDGRNYLSSYSYRVGK